MNQENSLKVQSESLNRRITARDFAKIYVESAINVMSRYSNKKNPFVHEFLIELFAEMSNHLKVDLVKCPRLFYPLSSYGPVTLGNNGEASFVNGAPFSVVEFYMPIRDRGYCVRLSQRAKGEKSIDELTEGVIKDIGSVLENGLRDLSCPTNLSEKVKLPPPYVPDTLTTVYRGISYVDVSSLPKISFSQEASKEEIEKFRDSCFHRGLTFTEFVARCYYDPSEVGAKT